MKTEIIYTKTRSNVIKSFVNTIIQCSVVRYLAMFFSYTLEQKINETQALYLLHAHMSFIALLLFGGISAFVAVLLFVWFAVSVLQCVKALR